MKQLVSLVTWLWLGIVGCGSPGEAGIDGGGGGTDGGGGADGAMAGGKQLSPKGASIVRVSQDGQFAAFTDLQFHQVHVVPLSPSPNLPAIDFSEQNVEEIFWFRNTLTIIHDVNASARTGSVSFWKSGMTTTDSVTTTAFLTGAGHAHPMWDVSPDGNAVMFAKPNMDGTADIQVKTIGQSSANSILTNVPAGAGCGTPIGAWASPTTVLVLGCDPGTSGVLHLKRVPAAGGTATTLSTGPDSILFFLPSTGADGAVDGNFVAYLTWPGGSYVASLSIVNLSDNNVIAVDSGLPFGPGGDHAYYPIQAFRGRDLFYVNANQAMKKASVNQAGAAVTSTTIVPSGVRDWALPSRGGRGFSQDFASVIYYTSEGTSPVQVGNMSLVGTSGAGMPMPLNTDNKGYPGDDAYSKNGTYVYWYDGVDPITAIGTIHARKVDGSDQPKVIGPAGILVRQTATDNIVAVMAHATQMNNIFFGSLLRVDVATGTSNVVADQINYMDLAYPASGPTRVVYCRGDGVYVTDF